MSLPFSVNFFGATYSSLYLNNNGNLTFDSPLGEYTPFPLSSTSRKMIAPFFADVDTRAGALATFGSGTFDGRQAWGVTWPGVGCFNQINSVLNHFQVILVDRSNIHAGDFDLVFNYDQIEWETGTASGGGATCLGGTSARAGFASGDPATGNYYELPGSGVNGGLLDGNTMTSLVGHTYVPIPYAPHAGRYMYQFRNGRPPVTLGAPWPATGVGRGDATAHNPTCSTARPVNCASGNFWHSFVDFDLPARGPDLQFERTFNSLRATTPGMFGYGWSSTYDSRLSVNGDGSVTIVLADGSELTATDNGDGTFLTPSWANATLSLNADSSYRFEQHHRLTYTYASTGRLLSIEDPNGYALSLTYDVNGQLSSVTDAAGRALAFTSDTNGRVASATAGTRTVHYTYDAGNLIDVTDPDGGHTTFGYDDAHRVVTMRTPRFNSDGALPAAPADCSAATGPIHVTSNHYDTNGRVDCQYDPAGQRTSFAYTDSNYSAGGGTTAITDPRGITELQHYKNGMLSSITQAADTADEATSTYTYDDATLGMTSRTDANGHTISFTFDDTGNTTSVTDALSNTATFTYDATDHLTTATDPAGLVSTFEYDTAGNPTSAQTTTADETQTTSFTYGDAAHPGDITSAIDALGNTWSYTYTANGDLSSISDPLGNTTTISYDAIGRRIATVSPRGNKAGANPGNYRTTYAYDPLNRLTLLTDALGHQTSWTYDADGNTTGSVDAAGNTTAYAYDSLSRLTNVTKPDGTNAGTGYDADGNITSQTDGLGHTTTYAYDARNHLASTTDPLNRTTTYTYDDVGNLLTTTNPAGKVTTYTYDESNRLTTIGYSDDVTPPVAYAYNTRGQITRETDGAIFDRANTYDSLGRLLTTVDTTPSAAPGVNRTQSVTYSYDLANRVTSIDPCNNLGVCRHLTRTYDDAGRMHTVDDGLGHTTTLFHDPDGNQTATNFANGTGAIYSYDATGQLTNTEVTTNGAQLTYPSPRNNLNLITADTQTGTPAGPNLNYGYDPLQRLTTVSSSAATGATYTYDDANRITTWINAVASRTFAYDNASQLTTKTTRPLVGAAITNTYTYDPQGNRTSEHSSGGGSTTYAYDQANRLTTVNGYATSALGTLTGTPSTRTFGYDSHGLRTDLNWNLAEGMPTVLNDETGNTYLTGPDGLPVEQISPAGGITYYIHDHVGSTRALTNAAGNVIATYAYDPYGNSTTSSTAINPFRFAGQYTDTATGLIYMRARWYDPASGQFISRDPAQATSWSPYQYASNDPANRVDPMGLYDYTYREWVGHRSMFGSSGTVMSFFKIRMQDVFPFPITGCSGFTEGMICTLHPSVSWWPVHGVGDVMVTDVTANSFSFVVTSNGYFDEAGSRIDFSICEDGDDLYLQQHGSASSRFPVSLFAEWAAQATWRQQAQNLYDLMMLNFYPSSNPWSYGEQPSAGPTPPAYFPT